jgi:hypothetical protein
LEQEVLAIEQVHAETGQIVAGKRAGRESGEEIIFMMPPAQPFRIPQQPQPAMKKKLDVAWENI